MYIVLENSYVPHIYSTKKENETICSSRHSVFKYNRANGRYYQYCLLWDSHLKAVPLEQRSIVQKQKQIHGVIQTMYNYGKKQGQFVFLNLSVMHLGLYDSLPYN